MNERLEIKIINKILCLLIVHSEGDINEEETLKRMHYVLSHIPEVQKHELLFDIFNILEETKKNKNENLKEKVSEITSTLSHHGYEVDNYFN